MTSNYKTFYEIFQSDPTYLHRNLQAKSADGRHHIGKGRPDVRSIPQRPGVTPANSSKNNTNPRRKRTRIARRQKWAIR